MVESSSSIEPRICIIEDMIIQCEGAWTIPNLAALDHALQTIKWPDMSELMCDTMKISAMDTGGAVLLHRTLMTLRKEGRRVSVQGLRAEFGELLQMVSCNRSRIDEVDVSEPGYLSQLEQWGRQKSQQAVRALDFVGEATVHVSGALRRPSLIRWRAVFHSLDRDGYHALPITGLLAFLMGVVIAYQGAEQLRQFGANIFVVDLVGISLFREISPLIVAILIAGRSGSAYAAQIGTMKVTEELDAVRTLGLSPMQLLVLPRVFALVIAVPLLTVYADILGVIGGALVASSQLNVSGVEFVGRFEESVALRHFFLGMGKAPCFAVIIAMVGCYQGFQIRGNVDDVGKRTTIGVVQSIFLVIVFDAVCSIVFSWWKI
ncbi:MAG: MlaE family lipid ABC transporter permease subunit [Nitrospirales bacterium]|nr:MlaE family lipid ABC transporter permease subunit [Nitrospirales bacterium]MBA3966837.1 MlaE family lipid ABC transporter permease subunit [Nitrospirales bacterium]